MRRREGRLDYAIGPAEEFAARVKELDEDPGAFGVDGVDQPLEGRDAVVGCAHQQRFGIARRFMHADHLNDDQSRTTLRAGALIGDQRASDGRPPSGR